MMMKVLHYPVQYCTTVCGSKGPKKAGLLICQGGGLAFKPHLEHTVAGFVAPLT